MFVTVCYHCLLSIIVQLNQCNSKMFLTDIHINWYSQAKYEYAMKHAPSVNIVTPSWVTDCIKNRKRLDEKLYRPGNESSHITADDKSPLSSKPVTDSKSSDTKSSTTSKYSTSLPKPLSPSSVTSTKAEISPAIVTEEVRSIKVAETPTIDGRKIQDIQEFSSVQEIQERAIKKNVGQSAEEKTEICDEFEGEDHHL